MPDNGIVTFRETGSFEGIETKTQVIGDRPQLIYNFSYCFSMLSDRKTWSVPDYPRLPDYRVVGQATGGSTCSSNDKEIGMGQPSLVGAVDNPGTVRGKRRLIGRQIGSTGNPAFKNRSDHFPGYCRSHRVGHGWNRRSSGLLCRSRRNRAD